MCIPETLQTKHHVKWAKHENAVHLERKPYFLWQGGDACWGCVILTGKKGCSEEDIPSSLLSALSLEWLQWSDWGYLDSSLSVNEGHLSVYLLYSLIDRHALYYLVQSFCTSAGDKNVLIGNKTPPNWLKFFCPRKQRMGILMVHHVLPQWIDNYPLRSSPDRYRGTYGRWDLLCR